MAMSTDASVPRVQAAVGQPTGAADEDPVGSGTRRLLIAFALLTALATNQLLVLGGDTEHYWAWTIMAEPTVAFLGGAYAAGFLLSVLSLRQRSWEHVRVAVATVTVFTVLTLVATLVHTHRLHFAAADPVARAAAWVWLAVYVAVPLAGVVVLVRQQRSSRGSEPVRRPMPVWLRGILAGQGAVFLALGAVLFIGGLTVHHHVEPMVEIWPWPLMPLSSQALGAWLIALGVGAALVIREGDLSRLRVPAIAYTAFGVFQWAVLLRYRAQMTADDPTLWVYGALLTVIVATGGYGWWTMRPHSAAVAQETATSTHGPRR